LKFHFFLPVIRFSTKDFELLIYIFCSFLSLPVLFYFFLPKIPATALIQIDGY